MKTYVLSCQARAKESFMGEDTLLLIVHADSYEQAWAKMDTLLAPRYLPMLSRGTHFGYDTACVLAYQDDVREGRHTVEEWNLVRWRQNTPRGRGER